MKLIDAIPEAIPYMIGDEFLVPPGDSSHVFGGDEGVTKATSISKMAENQLVDWILRDSQRKNLFFNEYFPYVKEPKILVGRLKRKIIEGYSGGGDFDIILIDGNDYTRAISIEVKRFSIVKDCKGHEVLRKFENINELKRQGAERVQYQFHRVILVAAIEVDRAELRESECSNSQPFNMSVKKISRFYNKSVLESIHEDVGFGIIEACQYSNKSVNTTYGFGAKIFKHGKPREQDRTLSESIRKAFKITEKIKI